MRRRLPSEIRERPTGAPPALGAVARRAPTVTRRLTAVHATIVRRSGGRVATRWFGSRVLVLETVGRTSGLLRSAALVYLPDGDDLVVGPANAGAPEPPSWWLTSARAARASSCSAGSAGACARSRRRAPSADASGAGSRRSRRSPATSASRNGSCPW